MQWGSSAFSMYFSDFKDIELTPSPGRFRAGGNDAEYGGNRAYGISSRLLEGRPIPSDPQLHAWKCGRRNASQ